MTTTMQIEQMIVRVRREVADVERQAQARLATLNGAIEVLESLKALEARTAASQPQARLRSPETTVRGRIVRALERRPKQTRAELLDSLIAEGLPVDKGRAYAAKVLQNALIGLGQQGLVKHTGRKRHYRYTLVS